MKNLLKALFRKKKKEAFKKLSHDKEIAMVAFFEALTVYMKDPSFDNHCDVYKAHVKAKASK